MLQQSNLPEYLPTPVTMGGPPPRQDYVAPPKQPKPSEIPFDEWLIKTCKKLIKENETEERERIRLWVTLWKRFRGDSFGFFASRGGADKWVDVPSEKFPTLKKRNLFAPIVRSNTTNWLAAHVKLEGGAADEDNPEMSGAARVLQAVLDFCCERLWTEDLEERCAEFAQLSSAYLIKSGFAPDSDDVKVQVPVMGARPVKLPGSYQCPSCQTAGPAEPQMEQWAARAGSAPCPSCGAAALVRPGLDLGSIADVVDYKEMPGGSNTVRFVPAWEIKLDERHAQGGGVEGVRRARWLLHRFLAPRYEIEQTFKVEVGKAAEGWSEALKWQRALETTAGTRNARQSSGSNSGNEGTEEHELLELHVWYFEPSYVDSYLNGGVPFTHPTCGWTLPAGARPSQVNPKGTCAVICNGKLLKIYEREKNAVWSAGQFQMDATAFWGRGLEDLEDFQKGYNTYLNSRFKHMATGATPPVIIDGMLLDQKDVEFRPGRTVQTRRAFNRGGRPISDFVHQMSPQAFDSGTDIFAASLLDGAQDTMGVQPATVGAPDPTDKTFGGQALKRQASVALLIPSQKSKRRCKLAFGEHQAKIAQDMWMPEHFATFLSDEFAPEDIEAFKNAVIGRDLLIRAADGSDIPRTFDEKKLDAMQFVGSGVIENPAIPVALKSKLARYHGVDYDVENYERDKRLASFRYQMLKQLAGSFKAFPQAVFMNPASGQMEPHPAIEFQVLNNPLVAIFPETDQHPIHMELLVDRLDGLATQANQDLLLIALVRRQWQRHKMAGRMQMMEQAQMQGMAQMQAQAQDAPPGRPGQPGQASQPGQKKGSAQDAKKKEPSGKPAAGAQRQAA